MRVRLRCIGLHGVQLLLRFGASLDYRHVDFRGGHCNRSIFDVANERANHEIAEAIRAEKKWRERRMAMFLAFKATAAEGAEEPLLARLQQRCPEIIRHVVSYLDEDYEATKLEVEGVILEDVSFYSFN